MIERVDRVQGPLVVGTFYLVPTVKAQWFNLLRDWPVIGPEHDDREFFDFPWSHYHVDARFLPPDHRWVNQTLDAVLHGRPGSGRKGSMPAPVWRRRKCIRQANAVYFERGAIIKMREHYAGAQCARNAGGFVCPHRHAPLGSVLPVDGVITCPLHGLRIDAKTGVCL